MKVTVSSLGRFHAFDLARQLQKQDCLQTLFTGYPSFKVDADIRERTQTFPWLFAPQMFLSRYIPTYAELMNQTTTSTFDRWVSQHLADSDVFTFMSQYGLQTLLEAKQRGIKTVCMRGSAHINFQNEILKEEYNRYKIPARLPPKWAIEKEIAEYSNADLIEINSTFAYDSFIEQGISKEKLLLSPQGVNLLMFHPTTKKDKVFRVLYAGTMSLQKGIPYLLEALTDLDLPNFELVLVGSMLDELSRFFKHHEGRFRYNAVVPRSELYEWYSQASVFVLPSIQDGFGAVIAQAMACGIPVIATTNTGGRDIISDGVEGFIIPIRDPQAIREKVLELYHNPDLRDKMAQAALQRVQSVGGWDEYGERSVQAYKRLLE